MMALTPPKSAAWRRLRPRGWAACLVLIAVLIVVLALATAAAAQSPVDQATQDAIRQLGLQRELPQDPSVADPWRIKIPAELVWAVLLVGLALVLYAFRDMLPIWRLWPSRGWDAPGGAEPAALAPQAPDAMADVDELGRQGRFVEAIHMLLLLSLAEIRRHLAEQFADSLTSREILRSARLPEPGRTSLREIVTRVEWTYFGGYPATDGDYAACRRSFETLRHVLRQEPRA